MDLTPLFCQVDDFVKDLRKVSDKNPALELQFQLKKERPKGFPPRMSLSEMMTIIIAYHSSGFKNFKIFYFYLKTEKLKDFPNLLSYSRFIQWMPFCLLPLCHYLSNRKGEQTGINFIDSTTLKVCKNARISRNKVFKGMASKGKNSMGWFFGFKLHIVVNDKGDLLAFSITKGNTHDIVPVEKLCKRIVGKLFGDKGYISQKLFETLYENGLQLITNLKSNMKNKLLSLADKIMLRKRFIIETINDQLKNISDIEHSRHRSPINFLVNVIAGLIAYTWQEKRPSIKLDEKALKMFNAAA